MAKTKEHERKTYRKQKENINRECKNIDRQVDRQRDKLKERGRKSQIAREIQIVRQREINKEREMRERSLSVNIGQIFYPCFRARRDYFFHM